MTHEPEEVDSSHKCVPEKETHCGAILVFFLDICCLAMLSVLLGSFLALFANSRPRFSMQGHSWLYVSS